MIEWYWAVVALIIGTVFGWFICALCVASEEVKNKSRHGGD